MDGSIYFDGLYSHDIFENLSKKPLHDLVIGNRAAGEKSSIEAWARQGSLGAEMYVSTSELEYTMRKECFNNKHFIAQAKTLF